VFFQLILRDRNGL